MTEDIRYVDDPFEEEPQTRQKPKKLFGKTDLQTMALDATGRNVYGFRDNEQLKKFKALEEFSIGMDDESRMWRAWILHRIKETSHFNRKVVNIPLDSLIHRIGMESKRNEWFLDNRAQVLKKKEVTEIADAVDDMLKRAGEQDDN
jgi:hypothetical protein